MGSLRGKHELSEALEPWDSEEVLTRERRCCEMCGFLSWSVLAPGGDYSSTLRPGGSSLVRQEVDQADL